MTVLSGGMSSGHLWDAVEVMAPGAGKFHTLAPMLPMTAEDLGGMSDPAGGFRWPFCATGHCGPGDDGPCRVVGQCFYFGRPVT